MDAMWEWERIIRDAHGDEVTIGQDGPMVFIDSSGANGLVILGADDASWDLLAEARERAKAADAALPVPGELG